MVDLENHNWFSWEPRLRIWDAASTEIPRIQTGRVWEAGTREAEAAALESDGVWEAARTEAAVAALAALESRAPKEIQSTRVWQQDFWHALMCSYIGGALHDAPTYFEMSAGVNWSDDLAAYSQSPVSGRTWHKPPSPWQSRIHQSPLTITRASGS